MQHSSNYNFNSITSSVEAFNKLEQHIQLIIDFVNECDKLSQSDFNTLSVQIKSLDSLYSIIERCLKNGN